MDLYFIGVCSGGCLRSRTDACAYDPPGSVLSRTHPYIVAGYHSCTFAHARIETRHNHYASGRAHIDASNSSQNF